MRFKVSHTWWHALKYNCCDFCEIVNDFDPIEGHVTSDLTNIYSIINLELISYTVDS